MPHPAAWWRQGHRRSITQVWPATGLNTCSQHTHAHMCALWACVPTCMHMYTYVCPYACICIDRHTHSQRYTQHLNTTSTSVLFAFPSPAVWDEGLSLGAHIHTSNMDPPQPDSDTRYLQGLPWPLALPSCWHLAHHSSHIPSYFQCLLSLLAGDILYLPCLIFLKDWLHEAWALINWFSLTQLVRTNLWQPCKGCTMESLDPFVWFTSLLWWFTCTAHCTIQH